MFLLVCSERLNKEEKKFIDIWIEEFTKNNKKIRWTKLMCEMEHKFNKKHSDNKLKNYWYSKKRTESRKKKLSNKIKL